MRGSCTEIIIIPINYEGESMEPEWRSKGNRVRRVRVESGGSVTRGKIENRGTHRTETRLDPSFTCHHHSPWPGLTSYGHYDDE